MRDIIHPDIELPPADELRAAIAAGKMVLDVLIEHGVPIAFARTRCGRGWSSPTGGWARRSAPPGCAALELIEVLHLAEARPCSTRRRCSRPARSTCT